jgi:hypothetical protein
MSINQSSIFCSKFVLCEQWQLVIGCRSLCLSWQCSMNRYTVGKITPEPKRDIGPSDFGGRARIHMNFPRGGTPLTPTHDSCDFKWKDYCPMVFRSSI